MLVLAGEQDSTLPWETKLRQRRKEKTGSNVTEAGRKQRRLFYILSLVSFFCAVLRALEHLRTMTNNFRVLFVL